MIPDIENEAMMAIDWAKRDTMFLERLRALESAMDRQRHFMRLAKGSAMIAALAIVLATHTSSMAAWLRLVLALLTWAIVRTSITWGLIGPWSKRTMAHIDLEHPKPPPLPMKDW